MKATIHKMNDNLYLALLITPETEKYAGVFEPNINYLIKNGLSILNLNPNCNIRDNSIIEGQLSEINNVKYFNLSSNIQFEEVNNNKQETINLIINLLNGESRRYISVSSFEKIKELAIKENLVTANMSNGFCVCKTYLIIGRLSKDKKKITNHFIKIKE